MITGVRGPNEHLIGAPGSRHQLGTPSLVIDADIMDANIASMARHAAAHDYEVRPVGKIHKSIEITRRQVDAGGRGPCCATLAEAEVFVDAGFRDVMLFTSVVTAPKLERLAKLNARAEDFIVCADHAGNVVQLGEAARRSGRPLKVLVDLETGSYRTGLVGEEAAVALAHLIVDTEGLEYAGVQGYTGDHMNTLSFEARRKRGLEVVEPVARAVERLRAEGLEPEIISGGGTGTHDIDHEIGVFTEIQAGTYVLMDTNYYNVEMRRDEAHPFGPALFVRTTIISSGQAEFAITDAGIKEVDVIFGINNPVILRGAPPGAVYEVAGDDMGRIRFAEPGKDRLEVGEVVEILPPHCYQTTVLYRYFHVVSGDTLVDIWPVDAYDNW